MLRGVRCLGKGMKIITLFFQMGEDTFNSLCAPVKREYPSMSYLCIISLFSVSEDPGHILEIVQQQLQIAGQHFISNQATVVGATREKKV